MIYLEFLEHKEDMPEGVRFDDMDSSPDSYHDTVYLFD